MLILRRKIDQSFFIGDDIKITVLNIDKRPKSQSRVLVGITAPDHLLVLRKELLDSLDIEDEEEMLYDE